MTGKKKASLALYVWEDVLEDYTSGMVCVLASSEAEAWRLLEEKDPTAAHTMQGDPEDLEVRATRRTRQRPRVVTTPEAFVCWGGG